MPKASRSDRLRLLEHVNSPLGFFTLCVLIIEVVLIALATRVTGTGVTALVIGMVATLGLLCLLVYKLATHPKAGVLFSKVDEHPAVQIRDMSFTHNDLRVLYATMKASGSFRSGSKAALGDAMALEHRIKKFISLNLATAVLGHNGVDYRLTREGVALAQSIETFYEAINGLKEHDKVAR